MSKRVLVTGGAGFVGSHVVRACLREGWQVAVLYKPESGLAQIQDVLDQIKVYPVLGKSNEVFDIFKDFCPDLVFHLASVFISKHEPEDVLTLVNSNIGFGAQILEAMAKYNVTYMVNAGTSWQHYDGNDYDPVNLYASTKQAFEDILHYYVETALVHAVTLKLFDTYGPLDSRSKIINLLDRAARERFPLDLSPGEQLIDIVYIDDVVRAFMIAAKLLFEGKVHQHQTYMVSSDKTVRLRDLVETYEKVTDQKLDVNWGGRPYRYREVMIPWRGGNYLPGWHPEVDLEQGIKKCAGQKNVDKQIPLVSVCIPVYNCEKYIAQAINSVLAQSFKDFELLIMDNASTDGTLEVIASYTDPRIRLIRNKTNLGLEANWNKAVTEARGKYIKLLPADDYLYPFIIERQVGVFAHPENESLALVTCARDIIDPEGKKLITRKFSSPKLNVSGKKAISRVVRSGTNLLGEPGAILFKRSILEKTGVFDGKLSYVIDVQLWLRMLLHGDLYVIPEPYCAFRLSSGSTSLELATLQSKHFVTFINNLADDSSFEIRRIDKYIGIFTSKLLGFARKIFYLLTVNTEDSRG
jgi:nucleoside-diphosphate-sugar epimerase/glycosyltransferase involved in cell wall biosynthesis